MLTINRNFQIFVLIGLILFLEIDDAITFLDDGILDEKAEGKEEGKGTYSKVMDFFSEHKKAIILGIATAGIGLLIYYIYTNGGGGPSPDVVSSSSSSPSSSRSSSPVTLFTWSEMSQKLYDHSVDLAHVIRIEGISRITTEPSEGVFAQLVALGDLMTHAPIVNILWIHAMLDTFVIIFKYT